MKTRASTIAEATKKEENNQEEEELDAIVDITKHLFKISFGGEETLAAEDVGTISTAREFEAQLPDICNEVFQVLGPYQLEATYQRALAKELTARGVSVTSEVEIPIYYKNERIATRRLDLFLQFPGDKRTVILELKALATALKTDHMKQLQFYMNHLQVEEGYLINFPHLAGFPADSTAIYKQEVLQSENGEGVSDRTTRSKTLKKDVLPHIIHVHKARGIDGQD
ncbi:hypothetical protein PHYBOEH_011830 [Phytophthora boehmeriae]|uniref:GxxExxY protein n=1 Tax=Phytophthora boehmeriae TaxID=109152 RepID=A0A8T1X0J2_9STRA|nr:hypothetical protein PHYBOEH_011830 [Phytophthora boehmeriae]